MNNITDYILKFGKKITQKLFQNSILQFDIPSDKELIAYGFNSKYLSNVKQNLKRGKFIHHINKTNGKVKRQFYRINKISESEYTQDIYYKNVLDKLYKRIIQNHINKYKGIDFKTDPITCETIKCHSYIEQDWKNNCKIVMSFSTIIKCKATKQITSFFDTDENGNDRYYTRTINLGHYISPYTKQEFNSDDIKIIPQFIVDYYCN